MRSNIRCGIFGKSMLAKDLWPESSEGPPVTGTLRLYLGNTLVCTAKVSPAGQGVCRVKLQPRRGTPVLGILKAGADGALAPVIALVSNPDGTPNNAAYFWVTGGLSSFLDNAPTYLVFFNVAGGDPATLMTSMAGTLAAISAGASVRSAITAGAPSAQARAWRPHRSPRA
jgi:hypothetical protein